MLRECAYRITLAFVVHTTSCAVLRTVIQNTLFFITENFLLRIGVNNRTASEYRKSAENCQAVRDPRA